MTGHEAENKQQSVVFDRAADFYDETRGFPPGAAAPIAALIARVGGLGPSSRVIEIGIGTGRVALPLAQHTRAVYGIDLSRPMLKRLQEKQADERVFCAEGDATRLPFPSGVFDMALVVHVLHLIPDWRAALDELARVLRPGAPLLYGGNSPHSGVGELWSAWAAALPAHRLSPVGLKREERDTLFEQAGWRPASEKQTYAYAVEVTPRRFVDQLARRVWSSTWSLTDEELATGIAAVQEAIRARFDDPDQVVRLDSAFEVHAYWPPTR